MYSTEERTEKISYEQLLTAFWTNHEPRWPVRRKARSVVWYHDDEQRLAAEAHELRHKYTDIEEVMTWTDAEEDHQQYIQKLEDAKLEKGR